MRHPRNQAAAILHRAQEIMANDQPEEQKLHKLWHTLACIQAAALARGLAFSLGPCVQAGPFKGMQLTQEAMQGTFGPMLLGVYESELHPAVEDAIAGDYRNILNIGCHYGYYAIGFARRRPAARIFAFDTDEEARKKCADMAALNEVAGCIEIDGEFQGENFAKYAENKTFAIVDIEGAEKDLLDPARYPALTAIDMVVELHDLYKPGTSSVLAERFAPTHDITIIPNRRAEIYDLGKHVDACTYIDPIDHLLVTWEGRDGPTPWAVMKSKSH